MNSGLLMELDIPIPVLDRQILLYLSIIFMSYGLFTMLRAYRAWRLDKTRSSILSE